MSRDYNFQKWENQFYDIAESEFNKALSIVNKMNMDQEAVPVLIPVKSNNLKDSDYQKIMSSYEIYLHVILDLFISFVAEDPENPTAGEAAKAQTCLAVLYFPASFPTEAFGEEI